MTINFEKAVRSKAKARIGISGPSGGGKTYSALAIASGLGDTIFVLDTERDSAQLYADDFEFQVAAINAPHDPKKYVDAIRAAAEAGADVLVIDSLSHAWQRVLEIVDQEKASSRNPHQLAAWAVATPMWRGLLDAILQAPLHVIVTMRSKTEWAVGDNNKPEKIGLAPEARAGIEYEFTMFGELNHRHFMQITKSRIRDFQDRSIEKPGPEIGKAIVEWLNSGAEPVAPVWLDELCATYGEGEVLDAFNDLRVKAGHEPLLSVMQIKRDLEDDKVALLRSHLEDQTQGSAQGEATPEADTSAEEGTPAPTSSTETDGAQPEPASSVMEGGDAADTTSDAGPADPSPRDGNPDPVKAAERARKAAAKKERQKKVGSAQTELEDGASVGASVDDPSSQKKEDEVAHA